MARPTASSSLLSPTDDGHAVAELVGEQLGALDSPGRARPRPAPDATRRRTVALPKPPAPPATIG